MLNKTHASFGELSASLPSGRHAEPSQHVCLPLAPARGAASTSSHQLCLSGGGGTGKKSCREAATTKAIPTPSVLSSAP